MYVYGGCIVHGCLYIMNGKRNFHNFFAKNVLNKILRKDNICFEDAHKKIYVGFSKLGGLGVFSIHGFKKDEVIEICPTIEISGTYNWGNLSDFLFDNDKNIFDKNLTEEDIHFIDNENDNETGQIISNIIFKKKKKKINNNKDKEKEKLKISKDEQQHSKLLPLGYGALYNHSDTPNAFSKIIEENHTDKEKEMPKRKILIFFANRSIRRYEEVFISYGKNWWRNRNWEPFSEENVTSRIFYPTKD